MIIIEYQCRAAPNVPLQERQNNSSNAGEVVGPLMIVSSMYAMYSNWGHENRSTKQVPVLIMIWAGKKKRRYD